MLVRLNSDHDVTADQRYGRTLLNTSSTL